jgi:hypothetical protein
MRPKGEFFFGDGCISAEMARAGLATIYESKNAEYGEFGKDYFLELKKAAQ